MNKKFSIFSSRQPAYSLVFAFLIMTVIMIVASASIKNTTSKVRYFNELEGASQARLSAESAAELAMFTIKDYDAGYEISETDGTEAYCLDIDSDGDCEAWGDHQVIATGQQNENDGTPGDYYIPIPGTGSAAPSSECVFDLASPESVDHPCNWNKLLYGETATVPLFVDQGGTLVFPADTDISMTALYLRVRTPCSDDTSFSDYDSSCARYDFDDTMIDSSVSVEGDDGIVFWQVNTTDTDGNLVTVIPDDSDTSRGTTSKTYYRSSDNTEIYESAINDNSDNIVLEMSSSADNTEAYDAIYVSDLADAYMQMDIISTLLDNTGASIPYLEWQLIVSADSGMGSNKAVVESKGYYDAVDNIYYSPYINSFTTQGGQSTIYTLSN